MILENERLVTREKKKEALVGKAAGKEWGDSPGVGTLTQNPGDWKSLGEMNKALREWRGKGEI